MPSVFVSHQFCHYLLPASNPKYNKNISQAWKGASLSLSLYAYTTGLQPTVDMAKRQPFAPQRTHLPTKGRIRKKKRRGHKKKDSTLETYWRPYFFLLELLFYGGEGGCYPRRRSCSFWPLNLSINQSIRISLHFFYLQYISICMSACLSLSI